MQGIRRQAGIFWRSDAVDIRLGQSGNDAAKFDDLETSLTTLGHG